MRREKIVLEDQVTCIHKPLFRIAYYGIRNGRDAELLESLQEQHITVVDELVNGETPLSMSLYYCGTQIYNDISKALIDAGASVTQTSKYYEGTALHRMYASTSLRKFMLEKHNVEYRMQSQQLDAYISFAEGYLSKHAPEYAGKLELYRS